jgi:Fe-S cluster assembly protein SufD
MAQVAERHDTLTGAFDAFRRDTAFGGDALARAREAAFGRFAERGFPSTRDEEWRFTSVAPIAATRFELAKPGSVSASFAADPLVASVAARIVVINGRLSREASTLDRLPAGVSLETTVSVLDAAVTPAIHSFVDLNAAFAEESVTLTIAAKAVVAEPVHVIFVSVPGAHPALISPRMVVHAGEQSNVSLVESYVDAADGVALTNVVADIRLAPGSVVKYTKIQRQNEASFHLASTFVHLARSSTFTSQSITLGGRIVRNDIVATLDGEGAECTLNGLYVANGDSLVDTHTVIDHAKPHCPSHEVYKGILSGKSRAVFNGKIIVRQDAQKTDAKQTNKALLLSGEATINTKPQLEIFADDVKCTHGAAIGQLDEDAMFYLQARGIGVEQARNLLIHAFAGQVLDSVDVDTVREAAMHLMEAKLSL